jgi:2',3'-cyclic-nucleotide 2'-phosphodiesterase (5'-nucleotidase family)
MISNKPWNEETTYYVGIPDYIANGGDDCDFLLEYPRENTGKFIREVVIDHLRKKQKAGEKLLVDPTKRIMNK